MNLKHLLHIVLFASVFALSALPGRAQCKQWDVTGQWLMQQNNGYSVVLDILQGRVTKRITGKAYFYTHTEAEKILGIVIGGLDPVTRAGEVNGNVQGDDFYIDIDWGTAHGIYRGKVNGQGRIDGTTYDQFKPSSQASWFSSIAMTCKPEWQPPPPASPKPAKVTGKAPDKRTGKPKAQAPTESKPSAPPPPPYILGNPPFAKIEPFQTVGKTMLVWDAGPEHPYAEVWLSLNGADETFVMEKGKGALEVTLQLGLRYKYILTDAGTRLATIELQAVP